MKTIYTIARLVEEIDPSSKVLDWEVPKMTKLVSIRQYFATEQAAKRWLSIVKDPTLIIVEDKLTEDSDV